MRSFIFIICLVILVPAYSFAVDFVPPEEKDPPLLDEGMDSSEMIPWGIASIVTATAGITLSAIGIYSIYSNIGGGFKSAELQTGIIMTVSGGIITAAASIVFDYIINETDIFKKPLITSQE